MTDKRHIEVALVGSAKSGKTALVEALNKAAKALP